MTDSLEFDIAADDGSTDSFSVPTPLLDRLSEDAEPAAVIAADVAVMAFAGRAHALVHHAPDEADEALAAAETAMLDSFEARFGISYGEATGHDH